MKVLIKFSLILLLVAFLIPQIEAQDKKPKIRQASDKSRQKNFDLGFLSSSNDVFDLAFDVPVEGDFFLFIIAIDKYRYWKSLNNAVKDAQDVKKVLIEKYSFRRENIYELLNEEASPENIAAQFEALKEKGTNVDNLLIYYSGHGYYDPSFDLGYWVPSDGKTNSGATDSYIPNDKIRDYIRQLSFRHIFLVADACFSGALFANDPRGFKEDESLKSRWGLSSGNIEVVSDGKKGENSPFAKYFVKFLEESLQDRIRVESLVEFVIDKVGKETQQQPQGGYLSGVGSEGGQFVFVNNGEKNIIPEEENKNKKNKKSN